MVYQGLVCYAQCIYNAHKKGNKNIILNLSKFKFDIIKLISENNSIIPLLSYAILVIHIRSWVTAQQSIFQKSQNCVVYQSLVCSEQCIYNACKKETMIQY